MRTGLRLGMLALSAFAAISAGRPAFAATATVTRDTPACTSWAGWREWVQASLRPKGARLNAHCPAYIGRGTKVEVIEPDDGEGAARVRWRGREWHTHADRLR